MKHTDIIDIEARAGLVGIPLTTLWLHISKVLCMAMAAGNACVINRSHTVACVHLYCTHPQTQYQQALRRTLGILRRRESSQLHNFNTPVQTEMVSAALSVL